MDSYEFMMQNGEDFWETSPDPEGWYDYTETIEEA